MNITLTGLWILIAGYASFLIFDSLIQDKHHGKTIVTVRLRRRVADAVFLSFILAGGLYYEITTGKDNAVLTALMILAALILMQGFRYPKWRLKKDGFIFGARYWTYDNISRMQLSEDGVLVVDLINGQTLVLPVARIEDLEQAAAFFTDAEALQHLLNQSQHSQT